MRMLHRDRGAHDHRAGDGHDHPVRLHRLFLLISFHWLHFAEGSAAVHSIDPASHRWGPRGEARQVGNIEAHDDVEVQAWADDGDKTMKR